MNTMTKSAPTLILLTICSFSELKAETVVSNLDQQPNGFYSGFGPSALAATSFTTGSDAAILNSATLDLLAQTNTPATFSLSLRTDAVGIPGVEITDFDNTPSTSVRGELLTFNTSTLLLPDTTYWLTLTVTPNSGFGGWYQTGSSETGIWTIGGENFSFDGGATWDSTDTSRANFLSLDATIVPEPSVSALLLLVIPASALIRRGMGRRHGSRDVARRG